MLAGMILHPGDAALFVEKLKAGDFNDPAAAAINAAIDGMM